MIKVEWHEHHASKPMLLNKRIYNAEYQIHSDT